MRALLLALCAALLSVPTARADFDCGATLFRCQAEIDNSGRVWFTSPEKLTEDALGDGTLRGGIFQVYQRVGNQTTLLKRPDGQPIPAENQQRIAAFLLGVSPDGERVYLQTDASLAPGDVDAGHEGGSTDAYVLSGGAYELLSTGPLDNAGPNPNPYAGTHDVWASDDGRYVYFETGQQLVPEDWDGAADIYQRAGGQTRLVSVGPDQTLPTAEFPTPFVPQPRFLGASPDGATAYFATAEKLTADDSGKLTSDIFSWRDGVLTRLTHTVSPEEFPGTPWEYFDPYSFAGAASEGSMYFVANSPQVPEDTDALADVYRARADGTLERVFSTGASGVYLTLQAVSQDGSRFFVFTTSQLAPGDTDAEADVYMWSGGQYTLVTPNGQIPAGKEPETHLCAISNDGHRAYFRTWSRLTGEDTDDWPDVYEWSDGAVRLVSPSGEGREGASNCAGISPNGRFVAFTTWEELIPGDNDVKEDIYVVDMGAGASASASATRPQRGKKRRAPRLRLVTAESIAPRMGVPKLGVLGDDAARLRLLCPKAERSGPCRGKVTLLTSKTKRVLGTGKFKIKAGRRAPVLLTGRSLPARPGRFLVRVRAADLLGNRRVVARPVRFR